MPLGLSLLAGFLLLVIVLIIITFTKLMPKKPRLNIARRPAQENKTTGARYYNFLFGDGAPEPIAKAVGLDYSTIIASLKILKSEKRVEDYIMLRILGFALVIGSLIMAAIGVHYLVMVGGLIGYYMCGMSPVSKLEKSVKEYKREIELELPRFLDLLRVNTELGRPITVAIEGMARLVPGPVSTEFIEAMEEAKIGKYSWQEALEHMSAKLNIEPLSDFISELIIASSKGTSISDVIGQKAEAMRTMRLNRIRERAAKMSSLLMMPLAVFKLLPLIGLILLPILLQVFEAL